VNRATVPGVQINVPRESVLAQLPKGVVKITFGELRQWAPPGVFSPATGDDQADVELPLQDLLARVRADQLQRRTTQRRLEVPSDIAPLFGPAGQAGPAHPVTPSREEPPQRLPAPPRLAPAAPAEAALPRIVTPPTEPLASTAPPPSGLPDCLRLPLSALASAWPAAVQAELTVLAGPEAVLNLPLDAAEQGLKRGKISVTWKQVRAWLQPTPSTSATTALADDVVLELPLHAVAPLFLARHKTAVAPRRVTLPENIPGLFAGGGTAPEAAAAAAAAPALTPPPSLAVAPELPRPAIPAPQLRLPTTAAPVVSAPPPPTADFLAQLNQRKFTPVELVHKTAALPGVAGALLALPEGLLVAGQLAEGRDADTVAGFVPQMFARNAQYLKEFGVSEPKRITITVDGVPLAIFKTPKIYLAVLGRAGQALPEPELAAAAEHLAR
jgi:predicted regulator of Ras-like GTPase activity (Roadblock/LC7/MglB family)